MVKTNEQSDNTKGEILPLSLSQYQVWIDHKLHLGSPHLITGGMGFINGPLKLPLFYQTAAALVKEHDVLRLLPLPDGNQQVIHDWQEELLEYHDFSHADDSEAAIESWWKKTYAESLPLDGKYRPWRIYLVRSTPQRYGIVIKSHHIVLDGYSIALAMNTMSEIYTRLDKQQHQLQSISADVGSLGLLQNKVEFRQFIEESNNYKSSKAFKLDKAYWQTMFPTLPQTLFEKRDGYSSNEENPLAKAHHHREFMSISEYSELQQFSKQQSATTYHLYLAAFIIYFCRIYNRNDIVIGVPVLNRSGKRYKSTLGMFTVIIPIKVTVDTTDTINSILKKVVAVLRQSYRHARYPASMLGQDLQMIQQGRDRIFDITLSFESTNYSVQYAGAPTSEPRQAMHSGARYPLSIILCEFHDAEPAEFILASSDEFFTEAETSLLAARVQQLIKRMVEQPNCQYEQLALITDEACDAQIEGKHKKVSDHKNVRPFIVDFEHQAKIRPDHKALIWAANNQAINNKKHATLSYDNLNKQANRLARHLVMLAVKKDDIVAVVLARKPETIVAFLAISKAGAAFLPIDPTLPPSRIEQQIQLSQSKVAIVNHNNSHQLNNNIEAIIIDGDDAPQHNTHVASHDLDISIAENDLAYVLFTSGSTGVPKGVLIEHGALSKRLTWLAKTFQFRPNDIALQSIQLSFDPALIEICLPLSQGAQVALPAEGKVAPTDLAALADHFDATHIIFVPTTLRYFNQTVDAYPDLKLRIAISGGELLPTKMAKQFVQKTGAQLYNLYGPTEGCIFATAHKFNPKESSESVPIGSPVDDTRIYILDKNLALLPEGTLGEVYIGGSAIARGYLNDEQLTKTQFVADPFLKKQRIYKTGDLGYWDQNGHLQFVSRIDDQMKLRGQRIAPQEVEAALLAAVEVQSAAVKLVNQTLHAWLVLDPKANATLDDELKQTIRTRVSSMLPAYMVPQFFNQIMVMPQQSSGKIEYKALTPQFTSEAKTLKAAKNSLEETLLSLFKTTLSNNDIGTDCHFYELGADSISSLTLLTNINQTIGETVALSTLLANPTVEMLAFKLAKNEQAITVDLNEDQQQTRIYIAASGHGDIMRFKPLGILLNKLFTLKMLQPPITKNNIAHDKTTIEALANEYANEIISQEQLAPPIIAGFSIGGITAFETARILIDRGIKIKGIVLIDTTYPKLFLRLPWLWRASSWLVNALGLHELSINQRQLSTLFGDQGLQTQIKALSHYTPTALDIPTTLIISSGFKPWYRYIFKPWRKLQKQNLDEKHVSGFHGTLFDPEHIDSLANSIREIDFER